MKYIDLHVHSNVSDGTFTPSDLVKEAQRCNLSAFALTDHDTTAGVAEAMAAAKNTEVEVIAGAEISAAYKNKDIHILGLLIDPDSPALNASLQQALKERDARNEKMANNLAAAGLSISMADLRDFFPPNTVFTRAHFAKYLLETGQIGSIADAFNKYLHADSPYYVPRKYITPEQTIALIKRAGGIPVLAHPLIYHLPEQELDSLIKRLKESGLLGIEVFYSNNMGFDEGILRRYANKYDLLPTGGSDFHGSNKPQISLGTGRGNLKIPYSVLDKLKEQQAKS